MSLSTKILPLLIPFLSLLSLDSNAVGSGKVVFKAGDPIVKNQQGSRDIIKGDNLGSGDTILTQNGIVQIRFPDKSFMSLKPKTEFVIDAYNYDESDENTQQSKYRLNFGEIRTVSGLIGKTRKKDYAIETPVATIGIRGTKFRLVVLEIPSLEGSEPDFQLTLSMGENGAVDIFLPDGNTIPLETGQVQSLGGIDSLIDIIQTDTTIQDALTNIEELPIALEQLNNDEGINQIIIDTENQQTEDSMEEALEEIEEIIEEIEEEEELLPL